MNELTPPSSPEEPAEPAKKSSSLLPVILLLAVFFLIVLVVSVLLLPDRGRDLLKLTSAHPLAQTLTAALQPAAISSALFRH